MTRSADHTPIVPVLRTEPTKIDLLQAQIDAMMRADEKAVEHFVEPLAGSLARAKADQHHFIFGRRGSGKSSLMFKALSEIKAAGKPAALVDLSDYAHLSLPNLLAETVRRVAKALNRGASADWARRLQELIDAAEQAARLPDVSQISVTEVDEHAFGGGGQAKGGFTTLLAGGQIGAEAHAKKMKGKSVVEVYERNTKDEAVRALLDRFATLLEDSAEAGRKTFIFLDDAYYVSEAHQPAYFHHMKAACRRNAYLKIGAVKHRTVPYASDKHGPRGLQLEQDATEIDLDSSLNDYATTQNFLERLLETAVNPSGINIKDLLSEKALERMVQASGGVARDFLAVLRVAIRRAQERVLAVSAAVKRGEKSETELRANQRIGAPDIWNAAGRLNDDKKAALRADLGDSQKEVFELLNKLVAFVTEHDRVNSILLRDPQAFWRSDAFLKLFEFKMVHILGRQRRLRGEDYTMLMLDVGELAHNQAFWARALDLLDPADLAKAERNAQRFQ